MYAKHILPNGNAIYAIRVATRSGGRQFGVFYEYRVIEVSAEVFKDADIALVRRYVDGKGVRVIHNEGEIDARGAPRKTRKAIENVTRISWEAAQEASARLLKDVMLREIHVPGDAQPERATAPRVM